MSYPIQAAYYVTDKSYDPVAIRPFVNIEESWLAWLDTSPRERVVAFAKIDFGEMTAEQVQAGKIPSTITLTLKNEKSLSLVLLTQDVFEKCVKQRVVSGSKPFQNDKAIQDYYLNIEFQ